MKSLQNESPLLRRDIERCHTEIAVIEGLLLAGDPDVEGLCMALADWSAELRILSEYQTRLSMVNG